MRLLILLSFISLSLFSQDTIYFQEASSSDIFTDSVNRPNLYPRQHTTRFQGYGYDSVNNKYYQIINKVSVKGLNESDSLWIPMVSAEIGDTFWYAEIPYRVIQKHYTDIGWHPPIVPALFVRIALDSIWHIGVEYLINDTVWYLDISYKCLQSHTAVLGWEPPNVPALWSEIIISSGCNPFVQPTIPSTYYNTGDCIIFNELEYESLIDNNVWSPDAYPGGWALK